MVSTTPYFGPNMPQHVPNIDSQSFFTGLLPHLPPFLCSTQPTGVFKKKHIRVPPPTWALSPCRGMLSASPCRGFPTVRFHPYNSEDFEDFTAQRTAPRLRALGPVIGVDPVSIRILEQRPAGPRSWCWCDTTADHWTKEAWETHGDTFPQFGPVAARSPCDGGGDSECSPQLGIYLASLASPFFILFSCHVNVQLPPEDL